MTKTYSLTHIMHGDAVVLLDDRSNWQQFDGTTLALLLPWTVRVGEQ